MRVCCCLALLSGLLAIAGGNGAARADPSFTLTHQGVERRYELHMPNGVAAEGPLPLVISLHGKDQSLDSLRRWLRFEPVADREGFAVAYPEALEKNWNYGRPVAAAMPQAGGEPADDIGFLRAMIDALVADGVADPRRIHVAGLSRGGLMAFAVACGLADRIAAVAPMITGMTDHQRDDCRPARPLPMLVLAGTADLVQRYDGWILPQGRLLSVPETLEYWRRVSGCTGQRSAPLPDNDPADGSSIAVGSWTGCHADAPLLFYRVLGGGHTLPSLAPNRPGSSGRFGRRNRDIETAEELWAFFRPLQLPRRGASPPGAAPG